MDWFRFKDTVQSHEAVIFHSGRLSWSEAEIVECLSTFSGVQRFPIYGNTSDEPRYVLYRFVDQGSFDGSLFERSKSRPTKNIVRVLRPRILKHAR
jgi:hypothetical protein